MNVTSVLAPIVVFAYNRPLHLQKTIESLAKNYLARQSEVFIYIDGAKNQEDEIKINEVKSYIQNYIKNQINEIDFKKINIITREKNWGLANSVIAGVSEVINIYKKIIVLEDDMISTPDFLNYMNDALNFYENENKIFSISGYTFPIDIPIDYIENVFITQRTSSWGWATWENRWKKADWQMTDYPYFIKNNTQKKQLSSIGEDLVLMLKKQHQGFVDSWAIRWIYTHFKQNAFCLYPIDSKIKNIGTDNTGAHTPNTQKFEVDLVEKPYQFVKNIEENQIIKKNMSNFFKPNFLKKIKYFFKYGHF
ncbi:MAG: glycosyltransferase [Bacteroidetes bacterium]|nr:MAG: glycosyltransferase [Bacteroidota bacterium]TAG88168.1 MAG: glycosyltransferase [Bacteroidota bacterium]